MNPRPTFHIDDLTGAPIRALIAQHLAGMHEHSPPESVHAFDIDKLRAPDVTFWSAWVGDELAGCGALRRIDGARGEIKSMRVVDAFLGRGVGRALVALAFERATARGAQRIELDTNEHNRGAIGLYESLGFSTSSKAHGELRGRDVFMGRRLP